MKLAIVFDALWEGTTGLYLERACRQLGVAFDHWALRDAERIPSGYDLYLRVDQGDQYELPWPDRLKPSAFYAIDTHLPHSWRKIRRLAPKYGRVFCAHAAAVPRLANAEWLPVACEPEAMKVPGTLREGVSPEAPRWDVAFVGTEGAAPRKFYLQVLRERYPASRIQRAVPGELGAIYGRAKLGFNYAIADDVNMRVFEVLAGGAMLVTNRIAGDDFERLGLRDGEHMKLYHNAIELMSIIDYYLAHDDERRRLARRGHELVVARHTYAHRMRQLLTSAERHLGLAMPPFPDDMPHTEAIQQGRS